VPEHGRVAANGGRVDERLPRKYPRPGPKCDKRPLHQERWWPTGSSSGSDIYGLLRRSPQRMKKHACRPCGDRSGAGQRVTTTAANLAVAIATDVNQTVLLVDLNLPRGNPREVRLPSRGRHRRHLRGETQLKDCLVFGITRLVVLPPRGQGERRPRSSARRHDAPAKELQNRYPTDHHLMTRRRC